MSDLIPLLVSSLFSLIAFLVAILSLVTIHELGHYLVGRWSGIRAEAFSVGFGPELFGVTDRHGTRWRLSAIPLGGYVQFRGDKSPASGPAGTALDGSFEAAPLRARAMTVIAGPAVNLIFAVLLLSGTLMWTGIPENEPRIGGVRNLPIPSALQAGDLVRSVGGVSVSSVSDLISLSETLPAGLTLPWGVERGGELLLVEGPRPLPPLIGRASPLGAAQRAGLRDGDLILEANGKRISDFSELRAAVTDAEGSLMALTVWRDGLIRPFYLRPDQIDRPLAGGGFERKWAIGVDAGLPFEPEIRTPSPLEALQIGAGRVWEVSRVSVSALGHLITGQISTCNVRGVLAIGEVSGVSAAQGAENYLIFVSLLSVMVGLMNLMPIPTLDGGHLLLQAWEGVRGRPASPRVSNALMTVGMGILIAMMLLGLLNDLTC